LATVLFKAPDKKTFSQRVRRLIEWSAKNNISPIVSEKIEKLRKKSIFVNKAYDFPAAPRTTNMVDRLMQRMDKHLFSTPW